MGLLCHHSWQPGARERLVVAAVDLYAEQGYDDTTVAQIAERAGVTKSTFFRHFPDKRELLVAGQEMLSRLLAEGTPRRDGADEPRARPAPEGRRRRQRRTPGTRRAQERRPRRGHDDRAARPRVPDPTARLPSELGVLAFKRGYADWSEADRDADDHLAPYTLSALAELRTATTLLG